MKNKPFIIGIILGVIYGLISRLLVEFNDNDFLTTMTIGFLFVTPAVIGAITVFFGTDKQRKSARFQILMPWVSIAAFLLVTMITLLEATACVVMLLPAFLLSASVGGVIMGSIKKTSGQHNKTLSIFIFLPIAVSSVENQYANPQESYGVKTEILIKADKQTVWENIKSVETIRDEELKWSFAHFIGMPKPIRSKLTDERIGGVRNIFWDKRIRFSEIIKEWKSLESFSYDVIIDTIPPNAVDPHIEVGGEYFSVNGGGYKLSTIDKQTTKLTLFCNYSIASKFNFYGKKWADLILDDFQVVILNVIKARCEKKRPVANLTHLFETSSPAEIMIASF